MNQLSVLPPLRFLYLFSGIFFFLYFPLFATEIPYILVSVAPHQFFVSKIAGNTVEVGLMVPAGASAHTYEPTPRQIVKASRATIWFRIGEAFENRAIYALKSHHPSLRVVDLREGLDLIRTNASHCHSGSACSHDVDLHFWLSVKLAHVQAETIAAALIKVYPEHEKLYKENLEKFHKELDLLDQEIQAILKDIPNRTILVSHPAYAYFCRDYGLKQFSIEFEGRDPTPQQLTRVIQMARELRIQTIFVQSQYPSKGARLIADQIKAKVVMLDPYSEHYFKSMKDIAQAFAKG